MAPHRNRAPDPVQCPQCGKTISRKADLARHMKTHSNDENEKYPCPVEGCQYMANQESNLKTHMNTHTKERPHKCPEENCPFDTSDPGCLTRHRIEQHAYVPPPRTRFSDNRGSEGVPAPRRRRHRRRNTSQSTRSAPSPSDSTSSSSVSLTDEQAQQGSNIASDTYDAQSSSGSVSSWDTHSPPSLSPTSDLVEGNQLASASPYSAETIINNFARAGAQSPRSIPSRLSLSPNFYQDNRTTHSSNVTHFAQVDPQYQSSSGSSSSWDPSLLLADEQVSVGSEIAAVTYHHNMTTRSAQVGHSHFASTASQALMTQRLVPEQGYPYAMVPAAPLFPTIDRSATEEAWNEYLAECDESYAATASVSMPTTSYGAGIPVVSAPTTFPSYSVRNVGMLTPAAIPRYGNQYHVGNMPPPAAMSSTSYGNQYTAGDMPPPASMSSTSYGAQYPINYASDGFYGHTVGNMPRPASMSSTSYGTQYPNVSNGNYGHTANPMSFGAQIPHQQINGSFANTNTNGYTQAAYQQAGGQGYLYTTHARTGDLRRNRFHPY